MDVIGEKLWTVKFEEILTDGKNPISLDNVLSTINSGSTFIYFPYWLFKKVIDLIP